MKYILTDVEGTTTSISFVHDTLFPYAKERLHSYVKSHQENLAVQLALTETQKTILDEEKHNITLDEAINVLSLWIDQDRKHPALKKLQGMIWKEGYESGALKGHVYPDVPRSFEAWKKAGLSLGVYSSGSVEAQKVLFQYSEFGNLAHYFSHHFDTAIGHKRESESYTNITNAIGMNPEDILFLSDIKEELDAASAAGFQTIQLIRKGDVPFQGHKQVPSFLEIQL